jgi:hypothetical protein
MTGTLAVNISFASKPPPYNFYWAPIEVVSVKKRILFEPHAWVVCWLPKMKKITWVGVNNEYLNIILQTMRMSEATV